MSEKLFDVTKAKELHANGLYDYQIAEQLGTSRATIQRWRTKTHLIANGSSLSPRIKKQCNYSPEYPVEIQEMMNKANVCLNCGKILKYIPKNRNRGFCSYGCYKTKPPKMAYAEKEYGKPIKEVVLEMLNDGATVTAAADRLGIGKPQFYNWMDKLDIKKKVVYA